MAKKIIRSAVKSAAREYDNEIKKRKSTVPISEIYSQLRPKTEIIEAKPQSFSDKYEEELKKSLFEQKVEIVEEVEEVVNMDIYHKKEGKWDVGINEEIKYFDPALSYEITGYRPIDEYNGLDFDPSPFMETARVYNETGSYTEYPVGSKLYNDFWSEQYRRCREGYTVGDYRITGDHYFFINFYRMETINEGAKGGGGRTQRFPSFLAKQYEFFHYVEMAELNKKDVCILKARGLGLSEIVACLGVRPYITNRGYRSLLTCADSTKLEPLKNKCWLQLNWLDMNTNGGMRHLRQKKNNADTKRASQVTADGVEYGWMSEIDSVIADTSDKIRGDRVDRLIFEEAGSNKHLIKSWIQGNALVELGGDHFGNRIGLGCVCAGTQVWTKDGRQISIENLVQSDGILGFKNGKYLPQDIEFLKTPEKKKCVRITTNYGILECSIDHPIFARVNKSSRINKSNDRVRWKEYQWIPAENVLIYAKHNFIGICDKVDLWGLDTLFDPYAVGALIGDGSYGFDKTPKISNCDSEILNYFESNYACKEDRPPRFTKDCKLYKELRIKGICQKLRSIGIYGQTKTKKRLPDNWQTLTKEDSIQLIAGLFDTDGTIPLNTKSGTLSITQSNCEILEQISHILKKLGIYGKIRKQMPNIKEGRLDKNAWYVLSIEDNLSIINFAEQIPLKVGYKKDRLMSLLSLKDSHQYKHYLENPGIREAHVIKVEDIGEKMVYNLTAGGSHTYLANNFITHNTGGDDMALEGLSTIFQNPEAYNVLPYKNYDTEDGKPQLTAFFLPAHKFSLKSEYLDSRGVTDSIRFKEYYISQRQKLTGKSLLDYCAEHCFIPNEALYKQGSNIFDAIAIADRLTQIRVLKQGLKPRLVSLLWDKTDGDSALNKVKIVDNPQSKIKIYEEPLKDENRDVFKNLYVAGIDSIDQGTADSATQNDVSDFCIVIKKRVHGLKEPKYVAIYKDRPRDIREAYDIALKLLTMYNCKAMLEHTKISIITYFKEKKKDHLFMKRPAASMGDMRRGNSQMIGTPATEAVIKHGLELINNFVNDYVYSIDSDEILEQLLKYSYENKRKFDIVAALSMAELADEELMDVTPTTVDQTSTEWQNMGWYTNEKGYKVYGILPTYGSRR